jgi:hypothetical protein
MALWLPVDDRYKSYNVETEKKDANSILSYYYQLLSMRHTNKALLDGKYVALNEDDPSGRAGESSGNPPRKPGQRCLEGKSSSLKFFPQRKGKFSPVKSPVRSPSWPYLHVLRQSPTVSKLLEVWNHGSVLR